MLNHIYFGVFCQKQSRPRAWIHSKGGWNKTKNNYKYRTYTERLAWFMRLPPYVNKHINTRPRLHDEKTQRLKCYTAKKVDEVERKRKAEKGRLAAIQEENAKQREIRAQRQR